MLFAGAPLGSYPLGRGQPAIPKMDLSLLKVYKRQNNRRQMLVYVLYLQQGAHFGAGVVFRSYFTQLNFHLKVNSSAF